MRILNAGCGEDFEVGTHFVDLYPKRTDVLRCDLDKDRFPFPDEFFDEVYSKCVFEHLTNPGHFMNEVRRVLKPKGKLTIITDNAAFFPVWGGFFLRAKGDLHNYRGVCGKEDMHYCVFTLKHLENWCIKFNFNVEDIKYMPPVYWGNEKGLIRILKPIGFAILPERWKCVRIGLIATKG